MKTLLWVPVLWCLFVVVVVAVLLILTGDYFPVDLWRVAGRAEKHPCGRHSDWSPPAGARPGPGVEATPGPTLCPEPNWPGQHPGLSVSQGTQEVNTCTCILHTHAKPCTTVILKTCVKGAVIPLRMTSRQLHVWLHG